MGQLVKIEASKWLPAGLRSSQWDTCSFIYIYIYVIYMHAKFSTSMQPVKSGVLEGAVSKAFCSTNWPNLYNMYIFTIFLSCGKTLEND